ncbi:MAG: glycosyltransferase family 87 protein, partial [Paracoccaceae bacterium]
MTTPADPALSARIEAAFGGSAPLIRRFAIIAAALMVVAFVANTAKMVIEINAPGFDGQAILIEFTPFWAAAKLGLAGDATAAFDVNVLREALQLPSDQEPGDMFWLYPPAWHIAIMPFGLMPFSVAYLLFSLIAFAAFVAAVRPLAAPLPGGPALVLAAPAVLIIMTLGNNSLLWTAGLAAAVAAMSQGRAVLAGCLIAALTLKPHLGLLVPFALAFGGHWRTVLWACIGTVAIAGLSTAVMGLDYWPYFFGSMQFISEVMQTDLPRFGRMMTWYALARL